MSYDPDKSRWSVELVVHGLAEGDKYESGVSELKIWLTPEQANHVRQAILMTVANGKPFMSLPEMGTQ